MHRVAVIFGMVAALAFANPAKAALPLPHNFFDDAAARPAPIDFNMIGNLSHGFGATTNGFGGAATPLLGPAYASLQLGNHEDNLSLGGNGFPIFNVRFDPQHDFYNDLTAQVSVGVPESSTWTMLLLGFAAIGFGMRRNRRVYRPRRPHIA